MPRYIDAEKLLNEWPFSKDTCRRMTEYESGYNDAVICAVTAIESEDAVDVEPVRHARMVENGNHYECPLCGGEWNKYDEFGDLQLFGFCPYCGAKMDGGDLPNDYD